jgi:hypothetical protein
MSDEPLKRLGIRAALWASAAWPVACACGYYAIFRTRTDYWMYPGYGMVATTIALPVMTALVLCQPSWRRAITWDIFAMYAITYVMICGGCALYIARFGA